MVTTKIYQNTTDQDVDLVELALTIPAGEHISLTSAYHRPVVLENYPGVIELDESHDLMDFQSQEVISSALPTPAEEEVSNG